MAFEDFLSGVMALAILFIGGLFCLGRRYILRGEASGYRPSPGPWPPAAVIMPVAGVYPGLLENLRSRLTQDYPRYQVIFATGSEADPATGMIRKLLPDFPHSQLVVCGPASACSQKNHNLLAGIKAVGPEVEILVFSDANQTTPAHWLQALVQPLVHGDAPVSSSFHHIIPHDFSLATLGRTLVVLMIYLGKGLSSWDQPWGGSTAITRKAFITLGVHDLWSHTVVDDVTLAKRLQQSRIKMAAATGAVLATPARETMASWAAWFTRQLLYLKFYFPLPWRLAGVGLYALLGLVLLSAGRLGLAALGWLPWAGAGMSALFLLVLTGFIFLVRPLHPRPGPWMSFLAAGYLTLFLAVWCHTRTWLTRELRWRSLVYTVDHQGLVTGIQEL